MLWRNSPVYFVLCNRYLYFLRDPLVLRAKNDVSRYQKYRAT